MSFTGIYKVKDAPIIVTSYDGYITAADIRAADAAALPSFVDMQTEAVLIIDTSAAASSSFKDILEILRASRSAPSRETPFTVHPYLVGTNQFAKLYVDAARQQQFGGMQIPMFAKLDDAIAAARQFLASLSASRQNEPASSSML